MRDGKQKSEEGKRSYEYERKGGRKGDGGICRGEEQPRVKGKRYKTRTGKKIGTVRKKRGGKEKLGV